ncbi:MAG: hypothetical protein AB7V04_00455 [Desulfomonilaceae bacterium]
MSGFGVLIDWLRTFWTWVETGFTWILDGFILLVQFVFFTIFDGLLTVIETTLAVIDLSSVVFNYAAAWSNMPTQLIWLITAVGLPQCFTILGAAYLIRLTLNLIPSWATRV